MSLGSQRLPAGGGRRGRGDCLLIPNPAHASLKGSPEARCFPGARPAVEQTAAPEPIVPFAPLLPLTASLLRRGGGKSQKALVLGSSRSMDAPPQAGLGLQPLQGAASCPPLGAAELVCAELAQWTPPSRPSAFPCLCPPGWLPVVSLVGCKLHTVSSAQSLACRCRVAAGSQQAPSHVPSASSEDGQAFLGMPVLNVLGGPC